MKKNNILKTAIFSLCALSPFLYGKESVFGHMVSFSKEKPLDYNDKTHIKDVLVLMERSCSSIGRNALKAFRVLYDRGNIQEHEIIAIAMVHRRAEQDIISSGKKLVNELKSRELIKDSTLLETALSGDHNALISLKGLLK